ncbi:MAG: TMEM165/GDT1 family protein [Candidatus Bathyarchaeia archaeon]
MDLTPLLASFGIIAAAELGYKTQLTAILLAAIYANPTWVFIGVMASYSALTAAVW